MSSVLQASSEVQEAVLGAASKKSQSLDLSLLLLTVNEKTNLEMLIPHVHAVCKALGVSYEILVVDGHSEDGTLETAQRLRCRALTQIGKSYGDAFRQGIGEARGAFIITIDADASHDPEVIYQLWASRTRADLVIASRYVPCGRAEMGYFRKILSRILSLVFGKLLDLPYHDLSSGFRLYRAAALRDVGLPAGRDFDVLPEALIRMHCDGRRVSEIPFTYKPRRHGSSHAKLMRFGLSYLRTLRRMWLIRNSAFACDYDTRTFDSLIPLQRYWQRRRHAIITSRIGSHRRILDIGCGSSRIIQSLPAAVALDVDLKKLRFLKRTNPFLTRGSVFELPFQDESFSTVICSEVIEHIEKSPRIWSELRRVLRPGGTLVIGTPDYGTLIWPALEWAYMKILPTAYGEQHIAHYTREELLERLSTEGFQTNAVDTILGAELIVTATK